MSGFSGSGKIDFVAGQVVGDGGIVGFVLGVGDVVVLAGFLHAHGIAIEILVGKERGDVSEIHDGEVVLPEILIDAGAAADDLLELGHGADVRVEDDELAGLGVHASGHQLGGGGDDGIKLGWADEGIEVALALLVVAGDLHHVFAVGGDEVGIGVGQFLAHSFGVLDVHAEDNGLGEAVAALKELGDLLRDELAAFLDDEVLVEVGAVVDAVFDELAVLVLETLWRSPAFGVNVERDLDDFVGREETVVDALLERVGVERVAEIFGAGNFLGFLWRGGEADVGGAFKVFENLAPLAVFAGAAAMALVHDDEIEEVGAELLVGVGVVSLSERPW